MTYVNTICKKYIYTNPEEYIQEVLNMMPDAKHNKHTGHIEVNNEYIQAEFKYATPVEGLFLFIYTSFTVVDVHYKFLSNPEADVITLAFYNIIKSSKTPMYFKIKGHHYSNNQISMLFNNKMEGELFLKGNHKAIGLRIDINKNWIEKNIGNPEQNKALNNIINYIEDGYVQLDCSAYQSEIQKLIDYTSNTNDIFYKIKLQRLCYDLIIHYLESETEPVPSQKMKAMKASDYGVLGHALDYMDKNIQINSIKNAFLSNLCNLSESSFNKKFKITFNQSPMQYFKELKLKEALRLLNLGASVKECSHKIGYKNTSAFVRSFKQVYGKSPALFIK